MITLYTSKGCKICNQVKSKLQSSGILVFDRDINDDENFNALLDTCKELEINPPKVMPVLVTSNGLWSGDDCLVAIEGSEINV